MKYLDSSIESDAEYLQVLLNNLLVGVVVHGSDSSVLQCNPAASDILGLTAEQMKGKQGIEPAWKFVYEDMSPIDVEDYPANRVISSGEEVTDYICGIIRPDRNYVTWVIVNAAPVFTRAGALEEVVANFSDITKRKLADEQLKVSENRFRTIFENKGTATGIFGDDSIIRDCNSEFLKMSGHSKAEIIDKMKWSDFVVKEDLQRLQKYHAQRSDKEEHPPSQYECRIFDKKGRIHDVIVNITLVEDMRIVSLVDITGRKKAEKEILRMHKLDSLGTIAGGIAHDFNNLLTGIFSNIEMAKMELPKNSPSSLYIQDAINAIYAARQLTGQLLTFAKGSAPLLSTVDTTALVKDTVNFNLHGSSISPEIKLQEGLWSINADKGQIGQVLANLIINAEQSMPSGGTLHVEGRNIPADEQFDSPDPTSEFVLITIRDEGIGIPPKIIEHIFDPYFSTKDTGHGLGLAVVNSIVEQHGGSISVTSSANIGSTFSLFLPSIPLSESDGNDMTSRTETSNETSSLHVLLMDDEEIIRKIGKQLIEHLGHTIDIACDGDEALQKYSTAMKSSTPFDLVIMDLTIRGGKGGLETICELLKIDPGVRSIVSSGYASDPIMADCTAYGFSGKLAKPFMMNDLKQEIIRVMNI